MAPHATTRMQPITAAHAGAPRLLSLRRPPALHFKREVARQRSKLDNTRLFSQGLRVPPTHTGDQWLVEEADKKGGEKEGRQPERVSDESCLF